MPIRSGYINYTRSSNDPGYLKVSASFDSGIDDEDQARGLVMYYGQYNANAGPGQVNGAVRGSVRDQILHCIRMLEGADNPKVKLHGITLNYRAGGNTRTVDAGFEHLETGGSITASFQQSFNPDQHPTQAMTQARNELRDHLARMRANT